MMDLVHGQELILALVVMFLPLLVGVCGYLLPIPDRWYSRLTTTGMGIVFAISLVLLLHIIAGNVLNFSFPWINWGEVSQLNIGLHLDELTGVMLIVVSFVSFLVHLFSVGYMSGDDGYKRYFALLGFFTFSMLGMIVADNLLLFFVFWELVGVSSYLLIGFWYRKPTAVQANKKAFIVNRIGDLGFVVGIMALWAEFGELGFLHFENTIFSQTIVLSIAGIGFLIAVLGKSAQFPLQVWLPDAMEGPTPVSALIHAATMVVAGVFLLLRIFPILTDEALLMLTLVGSITAMKGAISAINQYDIKKILAYSTISQLGYMVMAIGVGATGAATFHLVTHAFFKAGLFLSAGAVIFCMKQTDKSIDPQDIRNMGGLLRKIPLVFWAYVVTSAALVGLPLFSGFMSKDAILAGVLYAYDGGVNIGLVAVVLGFGTVVLTGYYMTRSLFLIFLKKSNKQDASNEFKNFMPLGMKISLFILAFCSFFWIFSYQPFEGASAWPMTLFVNKIENTIPQSLHFNISIYTSELAFLGIGLAYIFIVKNKIEFFINNKILVNKWNFDKNYEKFSVNIFLSIANLFRWIENRCLDPFINFLGILQVVLSRVIGLTDRHVVDGTVHLATASVGVIGKTAKGIQGSQVQRYMVTALVGLIVVGAIVVWSFF